MTPILLDTHAAVWSAEGKLRSAVAHAIDAAAQRCELFISPISAWEIGMLVSKGRLVLAQKVPDYIRALFARPGVLPASLTPEIAAHAALLPGTFHGDQADRIIVATANAYGADLVTRDAAIRAYAKTAKVIRCIPC